MERFFATVNQMFLPGLPGHLVHGKPVTPPSLTMAQLDAALQAFIVSRYHLRPHTETGDQPQERLEAGAFLPQMPERLEDLDLLLLTVAKTRVVHRDGIRFEGLRYMDITLADFVGESVLIRYDPRDLGEVRVFHDNEFLCRAICPELAGSAITLKDLVAARNKRRRELRDAIVQRRSLVEELLAGPVSKPIVTPPPSGPRLKRYRVE